MGLAELDGLRIWRDGVVCDHGEAVVSVWDRGLLYGDGVFEGLRVRSGRVFRPSDHLDRLERSCRAISLTPVHTKTELLCAIATTVRANGLDDAHVRVIVTRGAGVPGLDPRRAARATTLVLAYPLAPPLGDAPVSLMTSSVVRKAPRSVGAAVKSLNYLDALLAKMQANEAGADDALMLDGEGHVAEATTANIFHVFEGVLRTPPCVSALPGITRKTVIECASTSGLPHSVETLTPGDLYAADEAFLTGTAIGILPVASVDGRPLTDAPGPIGATLMKLYAAAWERSDLALVLDEVNSPSR